MSDKLTFYQHAEDTAMTPTIERGHTMDESAKRKI
jgi:hypothetical protein